MEGEEDAGPYWWTESEESVDVRVAVPGGTRAADVSMELTSKKLKLTVKGDALLVGDMRGKVYTDGSYWSMDTIAESTEHGAACDAMRAALLCEGEQRVVVLKLEKKSTDEFEPEEWMGVLLSSREANATIKYDMSKRDELDIKSYIDSIGGYNERCTCFGS